MLSLNFSLPSSPRGSFVALPNLIGPTISLNLPPPIPDTIPPDKILDFPSLDTPFPLQQQQPRSPPIDPPPSTPQLPSPTQNNNPAFSSPTPQLPSPSSLPPAAPSPSPSPTSPPAPSPPPRQSPSPTDSPVNIVTLRVTASSAPPSTKYIYSVVKVSGTSQRKTVVVVVTNSPTGFSSTLPSQSYATPTSVSSSTSLADEGNLRETRSKGLPSGGKTAIAVLVPIAAIVLLILAGLYFWRKRKTRLEEEEARRKEVEEYSFNPNNDSSLRGVCPSKDDEFSENTSGYRGWGTTAPPTSLTPGPAVGFMNSVAPAGASAAAATVGAHQVTNPIVPLSSDLRTPGAGNGPGTSTAVATGAGAGPSNGVTSTMPIEINSPSASATAVATPIFPASSTTGNPASQVNGNIDTTTAAAITTTSAGNGPSDSPPSSGTVNDMASDSLLNQPDSLLPAASSHQIPQNSTTLPLSVSTPTSQPLSGTSPYINGSAVNPGNLESSKFDDLHKRNLSNGTNIPRLMSIPQHQPLSQSQMLNDINPTSNGNDPSSLPHLSQIDIDANVKSHPQLPVTSLASATPPVAIASSLPLSQPSSNLSSVPQSPPQQYTAYYDMYYPPGSYIDSNAATPGIALGGGSHSVIRDIPPQRTSRTENVAAWPQPSNACISQNF